MSSKTPAPSWDMGEVSEVAVAACVGLREPARQLLHDYRTGLAQIVAKLNHLAGVLSQKAAPRLGRAVWGNPVQLTALIPRERSPQVLPPPVAAKPDRLPALRLRSAGRASCLLTRYDTFGGYIVHEFIY
jgi:hypothetical protein